MKQISILIPVYNQFKFTKAVIDYFEKNNALHNLEIELVIIDNNSSDETSQLENYKGKNIICSILSTSLSLLPREKKLSKLFSKHITK